MADRKNQGLAKRVRAAEVAAGITPNDRVALTARLEALERARGLQSRQGGVENRLRAVEAAE